MSALDEIKQIMDAHSIRQWAVTESVLPFRVDIYSDPVLWNEIIKEMELCFKAPVQIIAHPYGEFKGKQK